jgi:two-component system OmpR family sensor kinase
MRGSFRTLRFRLTLLYVGIFGLLQIALWVTVDVVRTSYLYARFDRDLIDSAQRITGMIDSAGGDPLRATEEEHVASLLRSYESSGLFFAIRSADGEVVAASGNLRGFKFPFRPEIGQAAAPDAPRLENLRGAIADDLSGPGDQLRLLTLFRELGDTKSYYLQVAASLAPMERVIWDIRRLLLVFVFVSLVVAAATSWYMARRALAPIGVIAAETRKLSAAHLDQRIPVPPTDDEISDMVAVINEMLERLETQFRNQQRFIADVSHELRTPLAVLSGEAQALARQRGDEQGYKRFVATVREETRRLLRTVESYLILSRVRAGERPRIAAPVSMEEVVLSAVQHCQAEARAHGVRVIPRFDASKRVAEPMVTGDFDLLTSMAENLVYNALRYSPRGATVAINVRCSPKEATITVRDRGPGIPEDQLDQVFELFKQATPRGKRSGSAGVGLAIAKAVAELHGGMISARNHPEGGAEFAIRLPLAEAP